MPASRLAAAALLCLAAGLGVALALFALWLHAPASHTTNALWYLASSGLVSLLLGGLLLVLAARYLPTLGMKIAAATLAGGVAAVVNILVTPLLMFKERADFDILVITLLFFIAIAIAFALFVGTVVGHQVAELSSGAERLASGDLGFHVDIRGHDEVAALARSFNQMSSELLEASERREQLEKERRDLLAAVSHDLRTPLASIRAMVEAIQDGVVTERAAVGRYLGLISRETDHLRRLIDDLFELSKIDSGTLELQLVPIDLDELLTETVESFRARAETEGVDLALRSKGGDVEAVLDPVRTQQIIENLIENALQHSSSGGQIEVELLRQNGHVQIAVADHGSGIARQEQERIFERFYRSDRSRSRSSGGAGLGLAIARGLAEAQGGHINVESEPGKGARFVVTL